MSNPGCGLEYSKAKFNMRRLVSIFIVGLCCASGRYSVADGIPARHARVELVSAQSNVVPGERFWLGVHFSLEKSWHIYWTNPGDSGQPPVFVWHLPSGFTAGAVQWPLPEKLTRSTLADYGYEDDVVLLVPVHAASGLKNGDKAEVDLQAKWLICSDVCLPDHAHLHLSLPVSSAQAQDAKLAPLFHDARKNLPQSLPRSWKVWAAPGKDDFLLVIHAGKPISAAQFFPLLPGEIENAAPQPLKPGRAGVTIALKKSEQLLKPISVLKGLLVLGDGKAYMVEAPVASSQAHIINDVVLN